MLKAANVDYYEDLMGMRGIAREVLEASIERAFEAERAEVKQTGDPYSRAARAYKKVRSKEFLSGCVSLFEEQVTLACIAWNSTPEVLCTTDGVVDYSEHNARPRTRRAKPASTSETRFRPQRAR